ncbi:MAG: hypothetical protein GY940_40865, partial [bacterium]|nr:hypothetical protein [bacterium]
ENKKMIKFINNEEVFHKNLEGLQKSEEEFGKYMLKLENGTDLEKVKADHINQLLNMVKASNLKVDSYRSEIEKKDGFVIFKYNVTIVGRFVQTLPFFARVREEAKHIYVSRYDIQRHEERLVRLGVTLEIVGTEG